MSLIMGLITGGIAGYIGNKIMDNEAGLLKNIIMGLLGGTVGSVVFNLLGLSASGFVGNLIVSIVGACICIWLGRKIFG